ncbi:hypothetical protein MMC13_008155 [Lambiella insularis]|nr:hypothetical protein [Lambiella insularis]
MPLSALLEGDFFNSYIKTGNLAMISENHPDTDNMYVLKNGVLRLELPRELYERTGLVGKPIRDTGRKHIKTRYAIEIELRLSSMVHGKKGFERIVWAFENVLNNPVSWLFHDFNEVSASTDDSKETLPLSRHHPTNVTSQATMIDAAVITLPMSLYTMTEAAASNIDEDDYLALLEWLSLVVLDSPRILPNDKIDPYLCQYEVPGGDSALATDIVVLSWRGFIMAEWVTNFYLKLLVAIRKQHRGWFALSASSFKTEAIEAAEGYTLLTLPSSNAELQAAESLPAHGTMNMEYILWEMTSGSDVQP